MALHIISTFDIFHGAVAEKDKSGKASYDITQWITITDLKNKRIYFRTYEDLTVRMVDFGKLDFNAKKPAFIELGERQTYVDVSETAN